ncbi:hypothetical protein ZWY2020_024166 [Hordeum vulgare]|nr:hypothetical protein ZWY2020_024166 [Hordeum vulgare]
MVRDHQQDDEDNFMETPPCNHVAGLTKDGDDKKKHVRNRASQEELSNLTKGFSDDQKKVVCEMGMHALMEIRCPNIESVFCTLGVPCGEIRVPYEGMTTPGEVFMMKLLTYLISSIFTPTTSLHSSNRCFPIGAKLKDVKNMIFCKFIADFLHDAFANKMYQKDYHLHLMLMYIGGLDLSTVDLAAIRGPPPPHKFVVYAWNYDVVQVVLAADRLSGTKYGKLQPMAKHAIDYSVFGRPENFGKWMDVHSAPSCSVEARAPVEHLVGKFSPSMTKLLEKMVEGWTTLPGSDSDGVARQFTSFVGERTHHPTGCPGQYDYGSSQELPDTQEDLFGDGFGGVDAGLYMDGDDDMENVQHDTDHDESREVRVGGNNDKAPPDFPLPEGGNVSTIARDTGVSPSKSGRAP